MPKENRARYVILGMLAHEPMSGYDIKKFMEVSVDYFWEISYGQIYPELRKLEQEGLAEMTVLAGEKNPDRKLYSISLRGREALRHWLSVTPETEKLRYDTLLKVFFGAHGSQQDLLGHLSGFLEKTQKSLSFFREMEQNLQACPQESPDHLYYLLALRFGIKIHEAQKQWALEAEQLLRNFEGKS